MFSFVKCAAFPHVGTGTALFADFLLAGPSLFTSRKEMLSVSGERVCLGEGEQYCERTEILGN